MPGQLAPGWPALQSASIPPAPPSADLASEPVSFSVADAGIVPADILGDLVNA
jgi:hypothetical protein